MSSWGYASSLICFEAGIYCMKRYKVRGELEIGQRFRHIITFLEKEGLTFSCTYPARTNGAIKHTFAKISTKCQKFERALYQIHCWPDFEDIPPNTRIHLAHLVVCGSLSVENGKDSVHRTQIPSSNCVSGQFFYLFCYFMAIQDTRNTAALFHKFKFDKAHLCSRQQHELSRQDLRSFRVMADGALRQQENTNEDAQLTPSEAIWHIVLRLTQGDTLASTPDPLPKSLKNRLLQHFNDDATSISPTFHSHKRNTAQNTAIVTGDNSRSSNSDEHSVNSATSQVPVITTAPNLPLSEVNSTFDVHRSQKGQNAFIISYDEKIYSSICNTEPGNPLPKGHFGVTGSRLADGEAQAHTSHLLNPKYIFPFVPRIMYEQQEYIIYRSRRMLCDNIIHLMENWEEEVEPDLIPWFSSSRMKSFQLRTIQSTMLVDEFRIFAFYMESVWKTSPNTVPASRSQGKTSVLLVAESFIVLMRALDVPAGVYRKLIIRVHQQQFGVYTAIIAPILPNPADSQRCIVLRGCVASSSMEITPTICVRLQNDVSADDKWLNDFKPNLALTSLPCPHYAKAIKLPAFFSQSFRVEWVPFGKTHGKVCVILPCILIMGSTAADCITRSVADINSKLTD